MRKALLSIIAAILTANFCQASQKTDVFTTKNGKEVKITCIKHASLRIEYDGQEIQVDPVTDAVKPITDYSMFPKANIILVTHEHYDHFDREAIAMLRSTLTNIYSNYAVYNTFHNGTPMSNGDSLEIRPDIQLKAVAAYNINEDLEQFHQKGRNNGYILTLDGLRIYIAGDTELIPEMAQLGDIDIAFLPCSQPNTMTVDQFVEAAKIINPKVLYPYHYGNTTILQAVMKLNGTNIKVLVRGHN